MIKPAEFIVQLGGLVLSSAPTGISHSNYIVNLQAFPLVIDYLAIAYLRRPVDPPHNQMYVHNCSYKLII